MKTIVICGHGPGISDAVARRFGKQGFQVAIVARNEQRLNAAAESLEKEGIKAKPFVCDLGDAKAITATLDRARAELGPIDVLHWNVYAMGAGDLTSAPIAELETLFRVAVSGLVVAVQTALSDLKPRDGAVLVTNGGLGLFNEQSDQAGIQFGAMGLGVANAARHKTVRLLHAKLKPDNVYVGEVVVLAAVKGTAFDQGQATLEASDIAAKFWELYEGRAVMTTLFPS